ncbi:hypothetical protein [Haladaptatus sp. AB643]|uniref:hypothetical protein n=1 Tax=Haladaptatus sp. AB643 TaxID=2934174 RepID=UPI00209BDB0D|nr:hypothetical protein [Haladaptatus sp. AB643]MCO8242977.1 hypothetical protein [Haladaptatus sp. AB643]
MIDDTYDFQSEDAPTEERLLARMEGLYQYQTDLRDRVERSSRLSPYCHIPDLFDLDPEAKRPYSVPSSFISEQVGGNVSVQSQSGEYLDHEPLELMLGSFLPGGFKRRWRFDIWTGNWESSSEPGFADISSGISIRNKHELSEILCGVSQEKYTPYQHHTDDVTLYMPDQFTVVNPVIPGSGGHTNYLWDKQDRIVRNFKPDNVEDEEAEERFRFLASDPTSQSLWFKHLYDVGEKSGSLNLSTESNGLFEKTTFFTDSTFLKSYYATLLTLYSDDQTFSEVIRYRHEDDSQIAFPTSHQESQLILFDLNRSVSRNLVEETLDSDPILVRDLQFSKLYRELWDVLFFQKDLLDHAFSVQPLYTTLIGLDYLFKTTSDGPEDLFDATTNDLIEFLPRVIPDSQTRLQLLDFGEDRRENYRNLFQEHGETLVEIFEHCQDASVITQFAIHVFVHSLKHALASWAVEFSAGGSSFEAWYNVNFEQEDSTSPVQLGIYDTIQGGAGISKEVFDDLHGISNQKFLKSLASQGCCHIAATNTLTMDLLRSVEPNLLYGQYHAEDNLAVNQQIERVFEDLGGEYRHNDIDELQPMVRRRLDSLLQTKELTRFYRELAAVTTDVKNLLTRTPRAVDVVLALEDRTIFDSRVQATYDRFANRRSKRRDISEVAERTEELTQQCIHACPDCLTRHNCTHQYRYQEQMLDRKLLANSLATLEQ